MIAGGTFTNGVGLGSLKGEGKIFAPDSTWKIVVMMPANTGLANVTSETDVDVFAVNMPNVDNPGTNAWTAYKTTVDKIQHSTGYDFLSALPEAIQCRVEIRNCAPTARISGDGVNGGTEGQMLFFAASTSSDPDAGNTLSYHRFKALDQAMTVACAPHIPWHWRNSGRRWAGRYRLHVNDRAPACRVHPLPPRAPVHLPCGSGRHPRCPTFARFLCPATWLFPVGAQLARRRCLASASRTS